MGKKKDNRKQVYINPILHEKLTQLVKVANENIKINNDEAATSNDKLKQTGLSKIVNSLLEDYLEAKILVNDGIKLKEPYYFFIDELIEKRTVRATKEKKNYNIKNQIILYYAPNNLDEFSLKHFSYCYNENKEVHKGIIEFPVVDNATDEVKLYFLITTLTSNGLEVEIATGDELAYILNNADPTIQKKFNDINIKFKDDVTKFKYVYELVFSYAPFRMLRPVMLDNLFLNFMLLQDKLTEMLVEDGVEENILTTAEGVEIPLIIPPNYILDFSKDFILTIMADDGILNYWLENKGFNDGAEAVTSKENLFLKFWLSVGIENNFTEFYKEDNVEASLNIILSNNFGTDDLSKILEKYNDEGQE